MNILKFGGSSVSTPQRIKDVIEIVKTYLLKEKIAVVHSAFGGVTDVLISMSLQALKGDVEYKEQLAQFEKRHLDAVLGEVVPILGHFKDRADLLRYLPLEAVIRNRGNSDQSAGRNQQEAEDRDGQKDQIKFSH